MSLSSQGRLAVFQSWKVPSGRKAGGTTVFWGPWDCVRFLLLCNKGPQIYQPITIQINYLTVSVSQESGQEFAEVSLNPIKVLTGAAPHLILKVPFQAHSGCCQNALP